MKKIILAPNPTGTGHNMRMLTIGKEILKRCPEDRLIVLLGSMQNVFKPLFEAAGIEIVDLSPTGIIDYSVSSHLEMKLGWDSMIKNYFVPTFFNGDKILRYVDIFVKEQADIVISDYNINASIAAILNGTKNVFVTERHNFTLVDVEESDLIEGGFDVNRSEIRAAKQSLNHVFDWMMQNTDLIITDKPYVEKMDKGKLMEKYFQNGKAHFVGPIYAPRIGNELVWEDYGVDISKPYIVGTVSGTTMIKEDRDKNIQIYTDVYKEVRKKIPDLQLILLGNIEIPAAEGIHVIPYLPNWKTLIEKSALLVSHPGWITVTEVSKLNIPTIFYLPNFMEYHEVEAYRRLECLGLPVFVGYDIQQFAEKIIAAMERDSDLYKGYEVLAPEGDGLSEAVTLIEKCFAGGKKENVN